MPLPTVLMAVVLASTSSAPTGPLTDRSMIVKAFDEVTFKPIIPSRPDGPQMGVLRGNPEVGPSDMLLKMPKGTGVMHTHTADYHLTIISGEMKHGIRPSRKRRCVCSAPAATGSSPVANHMPIPVCRTSA